MCVIFFAFQEHPRYPLILLANRDEFYERPTAVAGKWEDFPHILAGRDLVYGGTWLGVTEQGRFAAVTNYRQPNGPKGTVSRGDLVGDFLKGDAKSIDYLKTIESNREKFSGFNLLVGEVNNKKQEVAYYSNRQDGVKKLESGIYGLSNHLLDTPWPKVVRGKKDLSEILEKDDLREDKMFELLENKTLADDKDLPDTGVGIERERILSPIFIETPIYGTRSSTILLIDKEGRMTFEEKVFR